MTHNTDTSVKTEGVWKIFQTDGLSIEAVRDVSLVIGAGEFVVLAGPSGSGKTTLLNLLGGLSHPTKGRVWIADTDITDMSERELARMRLERIGFVFQAYNLLPVLSAKENAEFPLLLRGVAEEERERLVSELFEKIGIGGLEHRRPSKLSGGQQQRVAVARAVIGKPALVLADEPTANLDREASRALLDLMVTLNRDLGVTFVFATHDNELMERAGRLIHLVDGEISSDNKQVLR
ncbi:MAG: ABC transporter ATP-binding protein [Gemmatimonadetes bacterium]|nr:ABC transporter ATP-binding protein [Gemmatimonadota bacterium]